MKKIIWAIALFSIFAGVFYACTKDSEMTNNKVKTKADNPQMSAEDLRVENLIVSFKEKIDFYRENPIAKSGEAKTVDSTIWLIEAATNYMYADASFLGEDYVVDTSYIEIPISNDMAQFSDIQIAYDETVSKLTEHYNAIDSENKELIAADVSLKEKTASTATFMLTSSIGKGSPAPVVFEDWYWGKKLGKCDGGGYYGQRDATDIIEMACNETLPDHSMVEHYYTDIETHSVSGFNNSSYCYHEFLSGSSWVFLNHCMDGTEIDYYYNKALSYGASHIPAGKEAIHYNQGWLEMNWYNGGGTYYCKRWHYIHLKCGIFHLGNGGTGSLQ